MVIAPDDFQTLVKRASAGDKLQDKIRDAIKWAARASAAQDKAAKERAKAAEERRAIEHIKSGSAYKVQAAQLRALTQQIEIAQQQCKDTQAEVEKLYARINAMRNTENDLRADIAALADERDYRQENRYIRWFIEEHEAEFDDFVEGLGKTDVKHLRR